MDLKDIKAIIDLMKKNSISEFELERQEFKIKLKRGAFGASSDELPSPVYHLAPAGALSAPSSSNNQLNAAPALPAPAAAVSNEIEIKSPMIGTFYRSSSPDKPPFVNVGDEVKPGKVICIIEAMKLFNEIESEVTGRIVKVLVEKSTPVEYDKTLFMVDTR